MTPGGDGRGDCLGDDFGLVPLGPAPGIVDQPQLGVGEQPGQAAGEVLHLEGPAWRTPPHFVGEAEAVLSATRERALEGVVAKRLDSPYRAGGRNGTWVKQKHRRTEPFLITAWSPAQPGRPESFFLARRLEDGSLERAGSVSMGLSAEARERLRAQLQAAELPQRRRHQRVRPVEPAALAMVDFLTSTPARSSASPPPSAKARWPFA
jgi:ATP-dependent DNA ligase